MVAHVFPSIFFLARNLRMRTVFNGAFIFFCLLGGKSLRTHKSNRGKITQEIAEL